MKRKKIRQTAFINSGNEYSPLGEGRTCKPGFGPKDHEGNVNFRREITYKAAFTLIELIVVMAVLGILTLLAAPKFIGYTQKATEVQIRNDVGVTDSFVNQYLFNHDSVPAEWELLPGEELQEYVNDGKVYSTRGKVESISGEYRILPKEYIKENVGSALKGIFIANDDGKTYYVSDKREVVEAAPIVMRTPFDTEPVFTGPVSSDKIEILEVIYPSGYFKAGDTVTTTVKVRANTSTEFYMEHNTEMTEWSSFQDAYFAELTPGEVRTLTFDTLIDTTSFGYASIQLTWYWDGDTTQLTKNEAFYVQSSDWNYYKVPDLVKGLKNTEIGGLGGVDPLNVTIEDNGDGADIAKVVVQSPVGDDKGGMALNPFQAPYGTYEAGILTANSDSMLHGFFLYGDENHEIDIEILKDPISGKWSMWTTIHNASHPQYEALRAGIPDLEPGEIYKKKIDLEAMGINPTDYNRYKIDFYPNYINFSINDVVVSEWNHTFEYAPMNLHVSAFYTHWLNKDINGNDTFTVPFIRTKIVEPNMFN